MYNTPLTIYFVFILLEVFQFGINTILKCCKISRMSLDVPHETQKDTSILIRNSSRFLI